MENDYRYQSIVDEQVLSDMNLSPEQKLSASATLISFRYLTELSKKHKKPIEELTREFLIQACTGIEITAADVKKAEKKIAEKLR